MKKSIFLVVMIFMSITTFAQNAKLSAAKAAFEKGDLKAAFVAISAAEKHKKTMNNPEVFAYKALILSQVQAMGMSELTGIQTSDELINANLDKAKSLDKDGKLNDLMASASETMINEAHNAGVNAYSTEKNYEKAIQHFLKKKELLAKFKPNAPKDTLGLIVIGSSYMNLQKPEKAVPFYEEAIALDYDDQGVYNGLLQYYSQNDMNDKYLATLKKAQVKYPEVQNFKLLEIDHYMQTGQIDEKMDELKDAANKNPDNINLANLIASIYMQKGNYDEQVNWSKKALAIDANDFTANFNTGVAYFNQAVKFNDELNFMNSNISAEYKAAEAKRNELAAKALPYFQKAEELKPNDQSVLRAMEQYYSMKGDKAKKAEYSKRLGN